ncbi:MAG: aminoacyl-tRNA hydrolase [Acidobacteria bacterium]|nr:MAG: aminoacyl-tRNA hydrolase [Acidobacteriota bacterium]
MKLIVGLGNPGIEYQFTPHNMGFLAIDRIAGQCGVKIANRHCKAVTARAVVEGELVLLAKPETYMNLSGESVRELLERYEADPARDLIVLCDELALPFGTIRVRERGSAGGHNGLKSIIACLGGSKEFLRVRLGVGPGYKVTNGKDYLLSPMRKAQLPLADEALEASSEAVRMILTLGASAAMNRFNQKVNEAGKAE